MVGLLGRASSFHWYQNHENRSTYGVTMTFSNMTGLKKRIFSENRPKLKRKSIFSLKKFQISEFHPVFWREMVFLTCPESFSTIPYHADIFQNGDLKYFEVATTGPLPSNFDGSPYPHLRGYPRFVCFFFHQNDLKGCKGDVLDARGHFLLRFSAAGDKPSGGGIPTPLGTTRVKTFIKRFIKTKPN